MSYVIVRKRMTPSKANPILWGGPFARSACVGKLTRRRSLDAPFSRADRQPAATASAMRYALGVKH